jgi:Flp pilus assembly protein TadD
MRLTHRDRGSSTPADALSRGRQHTGRRALAPAVSALVLALMGCTNPMQTSSGAPPPGRLTLRVADAALAAGEPDMALRVAELILRDQPRNVPALLAKGDALYAMGHPDQARGVYRAAVAIDPSSVGAQIGLGRTLVRVDPKAAEAAFLEAATRAPDNVIALSNLGLARDLQGRHDAAQAAYRQALAVAPDTADVKLNLGLSLALSGKSAEAVAQLRPLAGDPGPTDVPRKDLAAALTLAGDQVEARLVLRGDARPADPEATPPVAPAAETPLVAVASLARGQAAAAPDDAIVPLLDVRPAPVVPVMEIPSLGGPTAKAPRAPRPALAIAQVPAQPPTQTAAQVSAQTPATARHAPRHEIPPATLAATGTGVVRAAAHAVAAAPRRPARAVPDAASRPAPDGSIAPATIEPASISSGAITPPAPPQATPPQATPNEHAAEHFAQLAALDTEQLARTEWQRLQSRLYGLLDGRAPEIVSADVHGRTFWRLRTGGFRTSTEQSAFCSQVRGLGLDCW